MNSPMVFIYSTGSPATGEAIAMNREPECGHDASTRQAHRLGCTQWLRIRNRTGTPHVFSAGRGRIYRTVDCNGRALYAKGFSC